MDIEKLKRKRGRKSKKELEFIKKYEEEHNISISGKEEKKPKKRGRKPKGGKIVKQEEIDNVMSNQIQQNVILHLKCNESDIQSSSGFLSDMNYNPVVEKIEPYNSNSIQSNVKNDIAYYNIEVSTDENEIFMSDTSNKQLNNTNIIPEFKQDNNEHNNKKLIWEKLKSMQIKLHNNTDNNKQSACFWCTCNFTNPSISIPIHELNGNYKGYGCFCMPECAASYLFNENIDTSIKWERYGLLNNLYKEIYNYTTNIKPAPSPFYLLDKFYGNLTIEEFRGLNRNNNDGLLMVVNKPMTRVMPELFNDMSEQFNNSKKTNKSKYKLSRKNPPINKTVVNDKNWLF
tara:strand:- start:826 stop:1857 length:1032 start_codon:yes stop_codon:yes gene_type:complete